VGQGGGGKRQSREQNGRNGKTDRHAGILLHSLFSSEPHIRR
jgi:hypothetical protein